MRFLAVLLLLGTCTGSNPEEGSDPVGGGKADRLDRPVPYRGGRVLHEAREVHVYWGAYWNGPEGRADRAVLDRFAEEVGGSDWFAVVGEYDDAAGAPGPSVPGEQLVVDDSEPGDVVTDRRIRATLGELLASGRLAWDPEAVYFVFTPPGTVQSTQWGKSCEKICAYHYHFAAAIDGREERVLYAGIPHGDCPADCGSPLRARTPRLDQLTVELAHELVEAVTDPTIEAWTEPFGEGEVADRCEERPMVATWNGTRFAVQEIWSNAAGKCVRGR